MKQEQAIDKIISALDFSGGNNSWFDLWHTHLDWEGAGNQSWPLRKHYLEALLELYHQLSLKLQAYPHPYQLWIEIDEDDAAQDAVYIHTPNPNEENFPLQFERSEEPQFTNHQLRQYINNLNLSVKRIKTQEGNLFFLYDKENGVPL